MFAEVHTHLAQAAISAADETPTAPGARLYFLLGQECGALDK